MNYTSVVKSFLVKRDYLCKSGQETRAIRLQDEIPVTVQVIRRTRVESKHEISISAIARLSAAVHVRRKTSS